MKLILIVGCVFVIVFVAFDIFKLTPARERRRRMDHAQWLREVRNVKGAGE